MNYATEWFKIAGFRTVTSGTSSPYMPGYPGTGGTRMFDSTQVLAPKAYNKYTWNEPGTRGLTQQPVGATVRAAAIPDPSQYAQRARHPLDARIQHSNIGFHPAVPIGRSAAVGPYGDRNLVPNRTSTGL